VSYCTRLTMNTILVGHLDQEGEGVCYAALDKNLLVTTRKDMPVQV
jgi:hypothetical protein